MGPDPETAADLLYTLTYFSNELSGHLDNAHALSILQEKAASLKVDEHPHQAQIN